MPVSSAAFAMPKSTSFTTPSGFRIRFPGFTSLWITPCRCAYSSPWQDWTPMSTACATGNRSCSRMSCATVGPSTYSITM